MPACHYRMEVNTLTREQIHSAVLYALSCCQLVAGLERLSDASFRVTRLKQNKKCIAFYGYATLCMDYDIATTIVVVNQSTSSILHINKPAIAFCDEKRAKGHK
jgi:hypothetical protein